MKPHYFERVGSLAYSKYATFTTPLKLIEISHVLESGINGETSLFRAWCKDRSLGFARDDVKVAQTVILSERK